jgi:hypothetical protein
MEVTFPRIVLAEFNTHKRLTKNSASSRAIPVEKQIKRVREDPFIPIYWGKNQKGMSADEELTPVQQAVCLHEWLQARDNAVESALELLHIGVHKQITNRLLEPFMWHTVITTASYWKNFFALRKHKAAQPEIQFAAALMLEAYKASAPQVVQHGDWHLPLTTREERLDEPNLPWPMISAGRCARVSYLTHDGKRDVQADIDLARKLTDRGHMSPLEHVAQSVPCVEPAYVSNFHDSWLQLRKTMPNEACFYNPDIDEVVCE